MQIATPFLYAPIYPYLQLKYKVPVCTHTDVHKCTCTHKHTCTHTHTDAQAYTHTHVHMLHKCKVANVRQLKPPIRLEAIEINELIYIIESIEFLISYFPIS